MLDLQRKTAVSPPHKYCGLRARSRFNNGAIIVFFGVGVVCYEEDKCFKVDKATRTPIERVAPERFPLSLFLDYSRLSQPNSDSGRQLYLNAVFFLNSITKKIFENAVKQRKVRH